LLGRKESFASRDIQLFSLRKKGIN